MNNELIFQIFIDNTTDYTDFSKETLKNLIATSKQCNKNLDIRIVYNKYKAEHIHARFHDNIISHILSKNECDMYENILNNIIKYISEQCPQIQDWSTDLIISECKEYIYLKGFNYIDKYEELILDKYLIILLSNQNIFKIYEHKHYPNKYIFKNDDCIYRFYEGFEKYYDQNIITILDY